VKLRNHTTVLRGGGIGLMEWATELLEEAGGGSEDRTVVYGRDGFTGSSRHLWRTWRVEPEYITAPKGRNGGEA
jgi:hypothetical protein